MTELEHARQDAAMKLQKYVLHKVAEANPLLRLQDAEAQAVVDAISVMVIKTIEHYLSDLGERASNGN